MGLESDDFFLGEAGAEAEAVADYIDEDVIEISDGEEEDDEGSGLDDGTGVGNVIWEEANAEPPVAPGPGLKPAECGANVVNSAAFRSDLESGAAEPEPASSAVPAVPPPNAVQRRPRRARRLHPMVVSSTGHFTSHTATTVTGSLIRRTAPFTHVLVFHDVLGTQGLISPTPRR